MIVSKIDVANCLSQLAIDLEQVGDMLEAMLALAEAENCPAPLLTMSRLTRQLLDDAMSEQVEIAQWCKAIDMERIEREMAMLELPDTNDGQALRHLSRELATKIEKICHPAMRAITQMQNEAGEIDAMVRRARDMAGCLRWAHSPDRDPDKPEVGSLRATVAETMAARPGSLSAVMERRANQHPAWSQNDAR